MMMMLIKCDGKEENERLRERVDKKHETTSTRAPIRTVLLS